MYSMRFLFIDSLNGSVVDNSEFQTQSHAAMSCRLWRSELSGGTFGGYPCLSSSRRKPLTFLCMLNGTGHTVSDNGGEPHFSSNYKWRSVIAYDGTKYAGWQLQQKPATVYLMLEQALVRTTKVTREKTLLVGASRTDAGVHALGQVVQFYTPFPLDELHTLHSSLNGVLPNDIRIKEIAAAPPQFHPRYSAKRKLYHYKVFCNPIMDPFQLGYAVHVRHELNVDAMREAARYFLGEHDFTAFANVSKQFFRKGSPREIYRFDIVEREASLIFEVEGNGFFYKQVRNMVGLLLEIGKELVPPTAAHAILTSRSRSLLAYHAPTAPPHGLYLVHVDYDEKDLKAPQGSPSKSCGLFQTSSKCKLLQFSK